MGAGRDVEWNCLLDLQHLVGKYGKSESMESGMGGVRGQAGGKVHHFCPHSIVQNSLEFR